jgi:uncharacterized protein YbjT (DUF2867 family)
MILVIGATGQLGGKIARGLLARGKTVRILVRPGSVVAPLVDLGATVAVGDLRDRASLDAACKGQATVVTTANSARRGGDDNVDSVDLQGTRNLLMAAAAAGVGHFIYTSVLGASPDSPVPFLAAKAANEGFLRTSGMHWRILAPNAFIESWPVMVVGRPAAMGQPVSVVGSGRRRHAFVSEDDVAAFGIAAVDHPAAVDQRLPIGGPQALSWRDVVAVYERVLRRPITIRFVQPGEPVPGVPPAVLPLLAALDTYDTDFDTAPMARTFGVPLTTLEEIAGRTTAAGTVGH